MQEKMTAKEKELLKIIEKLIPWVGLDFSGPKWATEEAKKRNKKMCEQALLAAINCFPNDFNGFIND